MARLIDADALIRNPEFCGPCNKAARTAVICAPTIDAEPVRHGRLIEHPDDKCSLFNGWECSECKQIVSGGRCSYCPNCGAKMDLKEEDK